MCLIAGTLQFAQPSYTFSLSVCTIGATVGTVSAIPQLGSSVTYFLLGSPLFAINSLSGAIITLATPPAGTTISTIIATSGAGQTATTKVSVTSSCSGGGGGGASYGTTYSQAGGPIFSQMGYQCSVSCSSQTQGVCVISVSPFTFIQVTRRHRGGEYRTATNQSINPCLLEKITVSVLLRRGQKVMLMVCFPKRCLLRKAQNQLVCLTFRALLSCKKKFENFPSMQHATSTIFTVYRNIFTNERSEQATCVLLTAIPHQQEALHNGSINCEQTFMLNRQVYSRSAEKFTLPMKNVFLRYFCRFYCHMITDLWSTTYLLQELIRAKICKAIFRKCTDTWQLHDFPVSHLLCGQYVASFIGTSITVHIVLPVPCQKHRHIDEKDTFAWLLLLLDWNEAQINQKGKPRKHTSQQQTLNHITVLSETNFDASGTWYWCPFRCTLGTRKRIHLQRTYMQYYSRLITIMAPSTYFSKTYP